MTMIYLQAGGAVEPLTVKLELDSFVELSLAKLEQPGSATTPTPTTSRSKSDATWQISSVGAPAITFSIDWLGVAPQDAGKAFDAKLTITDAGGALLTPFAGSDNPTVEGGKIGPAERPTCAGTFGVAVG